MERYKILLKGGQGDLEEKKSRFIATTRPVKSEEDAIAFVEEIKKKYWDARHNCFAYLIGDQNQIQRCSDDGEPSQTAGRPMLDVLLGEGLHNVCVVVTRYFGGTLLGTGGLVRAYSQAVRRGLENSCVADQCQGRRLVIDTDYHGFGKVQHLAGQMKLRILDTIYTEQVQMELLVPEEEIDTVQARVTELTGGKAGLAASEKIYYTISENEVILFNADHS